MNGPFASGVSANDDAHNFEIKHKKTDDLPRPEFTHKTIGGGWQRWIVLVLVAFGNGFAYHNISLFL